jgi:hypothetical protein
MQGEEDGLPLLRCGQLAEDGCAEAHDMALRKREAREAREGEDLERKTGAHTNIGCTWGVCIGTW